MINMKVFGYVLLILGFVGGILLLLTFESVQIGMAVDYANNASSETNLPTEDLVGLMRGFAESSVDLYRPIYICLFLMLLGGFLVSRCYRSKSDP